VFLKISVRHDKLFLDRDILVLGSSSH
jgi:hypothetical protein